MTTSRLNYEVHVPGISEPLKPTAGTIALDESWTTYGNARLTVALPEDPAVRASIDPRNGGRVYIRASQQYGSGMDVSDLTMLGSTKVSDWTNTVGLDGPLSDATAAYATAYNTFGHRASRVRNFNLGIRDHSIDQGGGTLDLALATDEALLMDMANMDTTGRIPPTETALGAAQLVLASIGAAPVLEGVNVALEPGSAVWEPGQNAWDYIDPLMNAAGMWLYCDEKRIWHLTTPNRARGNLLTFSTENASSIIETLSRNDRWYDAVHVTYKWRDTSGTEQVRYDTAQSPGYSRVYSVEYNRPRPRSGAAQTLLDRMRGRGRVETIQAVANPTATPGQPLRVDLPVTGSQIGYLTQVQWNLQDDTMQVRSRDLTDAGANAWLLVPDGIAWEDVPDGTTWQNFNTAALIEGN